MVLPTHLLTGLRPEYEKDWTFCQVGVPVREKPGTKESLQAGIDTAIRVTLSHKTRYQEVETDTGVPWWFTGILHWREGSCDFNTHLHNGDPLSALTVNVPAGRPLCGIPCTWEQSAVDALRLKGFHREEVLRLPSGEPDWTVGTTLWRLERWNGFGYRNKGLRTPYLWASTNLEGPGLYVADGSFNSYKWSKQEGAVAILKTLIAQGHIPPLLTLTIP